LSRNWDFRWSNGAAAVNCFAAAVTFKPVDSKSGPDFSVRETLFVPLEEPGAILTYQIESIRPIDIEIHATPVLDRMWPVAIGGQCLAWKARLSAYVLSEPACG
jgi:hypothetical protein